ncbi:serine hydrolase domain-containing protein [Cyclobacterium jeungdonense]|uniref:Serine hydrolase n=1 Tax=Cyclobacterium jeungdonense TaxID=708087 RepID=A0ABT8CE99_9BACT|nr:serine hydrolase [Cyclobacterium jeungdonense]MDN3690045.1 serine hydrolase [Cyclobacterium jeungdonense]
MKNRILIVFFSLYCSITHAQTHYFPGKTWQVKSPAEMDLNKTLLDSAVNFAVGSENKVERDLRIANLKAYEREPEYKMLGPMKERGGPAGIILKNGYIVAQWGDIHRVDMTFSVTKSFLSTTAGLAIDQGLIQSVYDSVKNYVWNGYFEGRHNSKITWDNLLDQSSDWSGTLFGLKDWADRPPREGSIDDWKNRKLNNPGTVFEYNDVRVNLLAYSLLQVWRQPLPVVLKEKIMDPIGASTTWRWYGYENSFVNVDGLMMQSVSGGGHSGGGIFISAMDMARFGLLFSRKGKWNNQQLLSEKWVQAAHQPSTSNEDYGYMWWINTRKRWKEVSSEIYFAAGFGGNYIVIDDEHDLVVVTRWMEDSAMGDFMNLVVKSVTQAPQRQN